MIDSDNTHLSTVYSLFQSTISQLEQSNNEEQNQQSRSQKQNNQTINSAINSIPQTTNGQSSSEIPKE